jgi:DNA-binding LytR/AlgR family response regulator
METNTFLHNGYLPPPPRDPLSSLPTYGTKRKSRLIVQKGMEYVPLFVKDVVLIYTENKLTYVLDKDGRKYISDKNLGDLINVLDKERFFRANRQYIVNMEFIRSYRPFGKSKLQLEVCLTDNKHSIIISQENAANFRTWISEA